MSALIVPLLYPDSVTTSPHGLACWSRMPNGGNVERKQMRARATGRAWFAPSCSSINKRMAWRSDASDIASRSPATNAISPFPESSGPCRHQETESRYPSPDFPTLPAISNDAGRVKSFFSFFLLLITEFAHTSPLTHEACPFRSSLLNCGTLTCSARLRSSIQCCPPNISSITNQP